MARFANTFQAQTPIGAAIQNLGLALFDGPSPAEVAKLESEARYRDAMTDDARAGAKLKQNKLHAIGTIPGLFEQAMFGEIPVMEGPRAPGQIGPSGPVPSMTREDYVRHSLPGLAGALAGADDIGQVGALFNTLMANTAGTSDNAVIRSLAGSGKPIGVDQSVSLAGQDKVRADNAANDLARSLAVVAATPLTEGQVKGRLITDAWGNLTEGQQLAYLNVQDKPVMEPFVTADGTTVRIDKSDPYGMALPVPGNVTTPSGDLELGAITLSNKLGTTGVGADAEETAARRTAEAEAAALGITPEEYQIKKTVEQAMNAAGIYGNDAIPKELKDAYQAIMLKIARRQGGAVAPPPTYAPGTLPEGYEVVEP